MKRPRQEPQTVSKGKYKRLKQIPAELGPVVVGMFEGDDKVIFTVEDVDPEPGEDVEFEISTNDLTTIFVRACQVEAGREIEQRQKWIVGEPPESLIRLGEDALIMSLRLLGEDDSTFSPECFEVMKRWRPMAMEAIKNEGGGK